jgi:hypothetical protein
MGAVHVASLPPARDGCSPFAFESRGLFAPSHYAEGVVTVESESMHYVFDPSRDDRRIVTSDVAADSLASLFGWSAPSSAMAVALGSGRTATVSLGNGGSDKAHACIDIEGMSPGGN